MFDSLDEQIKHDEAAVTTKSERMFKWAIVAITSLLVFGGLYLGLNMME